MADRVTVIGWDGSPLTDAARAALGAATLVAGAAHHLALPEVPASAERIRLGSVSLAARRIAAHRGTAVVLADGDPGFFGVVRTLRAPEFGLEVEVVPAVSSVAAAFARAGMPWDDAEVVVAHPRTLRRAVNVCRAHTKVAVLTSPGAGPAELGLLMEGVHRSFVICEELGTAREQVTVVTSDKAADHTWRDPNVVIVIGGPVASGDSASWIAGRNPPRAPRLDPARRRVRRRPRRGRAGTRAHRPTRPPGPSPGRPRLGHRLRLRRVRHRRGAGRCRRHRRRPRPPRLRPNRRRRAPPRRPDADRPRHGAADPGEPPRTRRGPGRRRGAAVVSAVADRRPQRIVTHAATRDAAELIGRNLTEHGYRVECSLLQSVELDTRAWTEKERSVAFLLSGVLPARGR